MLRKQLLAALMPLMLLASTLASANPTEETVTIRNAGDLTYYEFRVNGEITEIKVVPKKGPAYYLVPSEKEDGEFVRRDNPNIRVPSWVIFRW